jgi:hypothetical protein
VDLAPPVVLFVSLEGFQQLLQDMLDILDLVPRQARVSVPEGRQNHLVTLLEHCVYAVDGSHGGPRLRQLDPALLLTHYLYLSGIKPGLLFIAQ